MSKSTMLKLRDIPKDWPVRPLRKGQKAADRATCGTCGLSWDDGKSTSMTPTPSARCPFEHFHEDEDEDKPKARATVDVLFLLRKANLALKSDYSPERSIYPSDPNSAVAQAYRLGIASLLETALHESGNYAGFSYQDTPYVSGKTDESRRAYHYSATMADASRKAKLDAHFAERKGA